MRDILSFLEAEIKFVLNFKHFSYNKTTFVYKNLFFSKHKPYVCRILKKLQQTF